MLTNDLILKRFTNVDDFEYIKSFILKAVCMYVCMSINMYNEINLKGSKLSKKREIRWWCINRSYKHKLTMLQMVSIECDSLSSSTTNENLTCLVLSMIKADLWANPVSEFIILKCRDTERVVSDTIKT